MSELAVTNCAIPLSHLFFTRITLSEAESAAEREQSVRCDAALIQDVHNTLNSSKLVQGATKERDDNAHSIPTVGRKNLSQLVAIRLAHQTRRATKSVKTRSNPEDAAPKSTDHHDRQRLSAQMAEVIHRVSTGLERNVRWKSGTAPGTRGPEETLGLTGNSANTEFVAKERVNMVCDSIHRMGGSKTHENT